MAERYEWIAHYHDGTTLTERPDPSDPSKDTTFAAVDHPRLVAVTLTPTNPADPTIGVAVPGSEGARAIFFRRRLALVPGTEPGDLPWSGTAVGFQKTVNGRNAKAIVWVGDDGRIVLTDRDIADLDRPLTEDD